MKTKPNKPKTELESLTTEKLEEMYLNFDWKSKDIMRAGFIAGELDQRGVEIVEWVENGKIMVKFEEKPEKKSA